MKVGDSIQFKRLKWTLTEKVVSPCGVVSWKYRVTRRYYGAWLSYSKCTYTIFPHRWNHLKQELEKDPNVHYTQLGWV